MTVIFFLTLTGKIGGCRPSTRKGAARRWWGFTGWSRPAGHGTRGGFVSSKIWISIGSGVPYLLGKPREEAGGSRTNHMTRDYRKGFLEGFEQA
jgi:hypothetical protein